MIAGWRLRDCAPGEGLDDGAARGDGDGWIPVDVPGDTYRALIAAGRLADPYAARNEDAAAWVRDREWWWYATVTLDDTPSDLVFDGLDTFADVYIDGVLLGRVDNMFRTWRFDVSRFAAGGHALAVCFHPTATMTGTDPLPVWSGFSDRISASRRTAMRKAQFGWGWDWAPDLPTVGIWRPVRVAPRVAAAVRSVNVTTLAIDGNVARVRVDVDLTAPAEATIALRDPGGATVASATLPGSGTVELIVSDARLWWTADLGAQPLYTLVTAVVGAPDHVVRVGLRTLTLDQSPDPDEPGTTFFRFILNGVPIFAKGANWVPASSFVATVSDATYRDLLERAVSANMNMIRVWGGGIYEPDVFYDACDRLGLLVWQDFMFACAPYPDGDAAFVANVREEAIEQVERLRHHACLALWCGNNENQAIHWFSDIATGERTPFAGEHLFHAVIPRLLADLDPGTPYWPGSPWGGPTPNSMRGGDVHDWTVWHGVPPVPDTDPVGAFETAPAGVAASRYAEDMGRFVSEFGLQGAADIGTLRRWLAPDDLRPDSPGFLARIKDVAGKASAMMAPVTGPPATIEQWVDFSQLAQAEGLKLGIEHFRRRTPHCSGALIWQHNDCWPCVSWSLIDYDGVAKASWYAVRRAFAPVIASFRRDGDAVEVWITNDSPHDVADEVAIAVTLLHGGEVRRERIAVAVPARTSIAVWRGAAGDATDQVLTVRSAADSFPPDRLLLAPVKDLMLAADPGLRHSISRADDGTLRVAIGASSYALAIRLRSDVPELRFSDNHFDLASGERRIVVVRHRDGAAVQDDAILVDCWNRRGR